MAGLWHWCSNVEKRGLSSLLDKSRTRRLLSRAKAPATARSDAFHDWVYRITLLYQQISTITIWHIRFHQMKKKLIRRKFRCVLIVVYSLLLQMYNCVITEYTECLASVTSILKRKTSTIWGPTRGSVWSRLDQHLQLFSGTCLAKIHPSPGLHLSDVV